jgi:HlyD family secretion protein
VKKGDLIVELDSSMAQDQVNQQLIAYEKANYALIAAKETLAIQRSVVESEISAADLKLEFAKRDLQKYLEGEARQLKRNLEIEISTVKENLVVATDRYDWSKKLHAKGFETKSNLDKDQLAVLQYGLKLEQATNALAMFDFFDFPKQKRLLESAVHEAEKELARVRLQGEGKLKQFEADVKTQESTVELNRAKLQRDQSNLAGCRIIAPQDGLAVYAMGNNRFSSESLIEEGATIRNRQEIIKLPDVSEMKLAIKIHESHINMIRTGLGAYVVLDSMPDQRFRGTVRKVSLLPDSSSRWGNPNLKVYATEILLVDKLPPDVKPGVSARAEIVVTNMENVLTVPLQAITTKQGKQVAYVEDGGDLKSVAVDVGLYNTRLIQIVSGLNDWAGRFSAGTKRGRSRICRWVLQHLRTGVAMVAVLSWPIRARVDPVAVARGSGLPEVAKAGAVLCVKETVRKRLGLPAKAVPGKAVNDAAVAVAAAAAV